MKFTSLEHLQRYLESNASKILNNTGIEDVLADFMSDAVKEVVYENYTPSQYIRREDDGGLSDVRNMHITSVEVKGGKVSILFENLTTGQTSYLPIYNHNLDSLHGKFISETIEKGIKDNWYRPDVTDDFGRHPSDPRPFVEETIDIIRRNPQPLIEAIKRAYRKAGFQVR